MIMIKIGGVSIDVSHPKGFAEVLESCCMDMKYEYLCKESFRGDEEADWFVERFGLAGRVEKIEDMVDKVDVGFIQSCNWEKHLDQAIPFLEKGKPVFIDKPIVGSMKDIKRLREIVKKGARILGSSSARHAEEIRTFLAKSREERGDILSIFGTCGVDEFNYGIHIVEIMQELAGAKGISCKYIGSGQNMGAVCEMYCVTFDNGITGTYYIAKDKWHPFHLTIMTTTGTFSFVIDSGKIYRSLLVEIYRELTMGKSELADLDALINCSMIMLCGKKSRDEQEGREVSLDMLTEEDKFDGILFEKEYASKASVIYKD